jgi:hypothetical protein
MSRKAIKALALTAVVAAALVVGCSDGVIDVGDAFHGHGSIHCWPYGPDIWVIDADDGEAYNIYGGMPAPYKQEGMRVEFLAQMTNYGSSWLAAPVIILVDIWPENGRFPRSY